jgi:hypothetical protein
MKLNIFNDMNINLINQKNEDFDFAVNLGFMRG